MEGSVTVGNSIAPVLGTIVIPGTEIATGADGKLEIAINGDSITVYPNSRMTVPAKQGSLGVRQSLGTLFFRMESRESRNFEVRTPYLAATIKGTAFVVNVDSDAAMVAVAEGSVQVTALASGQVSLISPGQSAMIGRDDDKMSFGGSEFLLDGDLYFDDESGSGIVGSRGSKGKADSSGSKGVSDSKGGTDSKGVSDSKGKPDSRGKSVR